MTAAASVRCNTFYPNDRMRRALVHAAQKLKHFAAAMQQPSKSLTSVFNFLPFANHNYMCDFECNICAIGITASAFS
jgi:hypothetical protein